MTHCWSEGELKACLDDELPPRDRDRAARHIEECSACRALCADLSQRAQWLAGMMDALPQPPVLVRLPASLARPRAGRRAAGSLALVASVAIALMLVPKHKDKVSAVAPRFQTPLPAVPAPPPVKPAIIRRVPHKHAAPVKPKPKIEYFVKLDDEPIDTGLVVRVVLGGSEIPADVIVGPDGRARAVRLVSDHSGEPK